ncbi:MAG: hypothetical protein JOZ30_06180 [Hyphomicrobiales bacterium]|nr:hypothetical protein [Hyphomicrobiales bacterium]MBV9739206.1 hypothetical protein [Hyphomicrobiales bacterium]
MNTIKTNETEERETRAYEEARSKEPQHSDSENAFGREARFETREGDPERVEAPGEESRAEDGPQLALDDFVTAERARPDIPAETADGLNELEEEVRHQAEDRPLPARQDR